MVAPELRRPKGMTRQQNVPSCVTNAVFRSDPSSVDMGVCQYPLLRSWVENQVAPCVALMMASIRGSG